MDKIQELINSMDPEEAASAIAVVMKKFFPLLGEDARLNFVVNLVGVSTTRWQAWSTSDWQNVWTKVSIQRICARDW